MPSLLGNSTNFPPIYSYSHWIANYESSSADMRMIFHQFINGLSIKLAMFNYNINFLTFRLLKYPDRCFH